MAIPGVLHGTYIGPSPDLNSIATGSGSTYAMAALNTGFCARFTATQNKDIATVRVNWATVTAAGEVTVRIETIDATTGKPSGTLYDANASLAFTPVAGWQDLTFASVPTTNLTVGAEYAVVLLTTTGGTAHTLRSHTTVAVRYPTITLTAADGTTRSNFAEVTGTTAIMSFVLDDTTEDPMGLLPYAVAVSTSTGTQVYTTNAVALKVVADATLVVSGVEFTAVRIGTPAGDLRVRILDTGGTAVSNSTVTMDKDSLLTGLNSSFRKCIAHFGGLASLAAGTYYVTFDSASSANVSNCWGIAGTVPANTTVVPNNFIQTVTTDITAGPPATWTDSATGVQPAIRLMIDSITAGSGGNANLLHGKIQ